MENAKRTDWATELIEWTDTHGDEGHIELDGTGVILRIVQGTYSANLHRLDADRCELIGNALLECAKELRK